MTAADVPASSGRRLGFRGRLVGVLLGLLTVFGVVTGAWLTLGFRPGVEAEALQNLESQVRLVAQLAAADPSFDPSGAGVVGRVVVLGPDGGVRFDSEPGHAVPSVTGPLPWSGRVGPLLAAGVGDPVEAGLRRRGGRARRAHYGAAR